MLAGGLRRPRRPPSRPAQRRRGSDNLAFLRPIRACYPGRRQLYWIPDNLSANCTPEIRAFAAANRIELVATPTYASYLSALTEFVFANADYLDWDAAAAAIADHVRHRNGSERDRLIAKRERKL